MRALEVLARTGGLVPREPQPGANCRNEEPFVAEHALRGRWRMRCRDDDLRVSITLAPTEPAGVQSLEVTPMWRDETLAAALVCR